MLSQPVSNVINTEQCKGATNSLTSWLNKLWQYAECHPEIQIQFLQTFILTVFAGSIAVFLIERYKALLNRQAERTKIFIPKIVELQEDSDARQQLACPFYPTFRRG